MEVEILSKVIGCIYDAALDPDLWPTALEQACAFLTGCAAAIYSQDIRLKRGTRYHSWGDDPEFTRVYFTDYVRINPLVPHMAMQAVGGIYCASTLIPYEQLRASRFFKEWVAPQGLVDFVGTTLDKTATSVATVSFGRNTRQGLVDDEGRRRMALLAPHFRRAVLIDNAIDLQKSEVSALTDTFAGLASGVFLLGASGRLVFANPTGQAMLDEGAVLRVSQGAVAAVEPSAHAALREAVAGCASGGDAAVGLKGIAIPLATSTSEPWLVHVLPLTSGARQRAASTYSAVAALFVRRAKLDLALPWEAIKQTYRLTPAELNVLKAITEAADVQASADMLGLSASTVKTHLQHVFEKTGLRRQADLVKLVAAHANPLK